MYAECTMESNTSKWCVRAAWFAVILAASGIIGGGIAAGSRHRRIQESPVPEVRTTSENARILTRYNEVTDDGAVSLGLFFATDKSTAEYAYTRLIFFGNGNGKRSADNRIGSEPTYLIDTDWGTSTPDSRPYPLHWLVDGHRFSLQGGHIRRSDLFFIASSRRAVFQVGGSDDVFTLNQGDKDAIKDFLGYFMPWEK